MKDFIETAVLMPTALSFFGNFKVEKDGEYKDTFNIKLTGWAPLILSVRMLAINNGILEVNTLKRIKSLREMDVIKKEMENDLIDAYLTFVRFRIMNQINGRADGNDTPGAANHINPDTLRPDEQEKIRKAMKSVEALQKYIQEVLMFGQ
jgi:signal-transduction protein with cAMP-binding, CBS, and nucleotidyltransferase domain